MGLAPYAKKEYTEELFAKFKKIQEVKNINFKYINRPKDLYFSIKSILDNKRSDTIASSLQQYTEYLVLKWVKNLLKTSINEICLAGGVAMNVKTNMLISKISKKSICSSLYVQMMLHKLWVHAMPVYLIGKILISKVYF